MAARGPSTNHQRRDRPLSHGRTNSSQPDLPEHHHLHQHLQATTVSPSHTSKVHNKHTTPAPTPNLHPRLSRVIWPTNTRPASLGLIQTSAPPHTDLTEAGSGGTDSGNLPEDGSCLHQTTTTSTTTTTTATASPWSPQQPPSQRLQQQQQQQQQQHQQQHLASVRARTFSEIRWLSPPRNDARSHQDPPSLAFSQPQAASTSPLLGHPHVHTYYHFATISTSLSLHMSPYMADQMADSMETMQTPVSPVSAQSSPHDTTMGDQQQQITRKRSHSVMSQQHATTEPHPAHSRAPSIHSQTGVAEDFSPRGSRAYKRGDPPTNDQGKYICDYGDECFGQIFDRKCEWSKHMDKHDRPYRCPHPSCAKLQGFTYSGGLLRHEREVHGKHGGPKSQLMCPFTDCKRHSGKGFTRKENLNEHLRRVHQGKETVSQQDPLLERNSAEVAPGADGDETQMSHLSTGVKHEMSQLATGVKRKRSMPPQSQDEYGASHLVETSEQELARLRADNALQADRIRQLEATVAMNAEEMQRLKETMNLWAQQTGGQNHHVQHEQQQQQQQHQQHQQHQELDHQQHEEHHQQQTEEHHHHDHHHPFAQHQQIVEQLLEYAQPQDAEQQQHEDQKFAEQLAQQAEPVVQQENTLAAEVKAAFAAQEA